MNLPALQIDSDREFLCDSAGCRARDRVSGVRDPFWVRERLERLLTDAAALSTLRQLLFRAGSQSVWRMSDREAIEAAASLVVGDVLHLHRRPIPVIPISDAVSAPAPKAVPFPLPERTQRPAAANPPPAPPADPPLFSSDANIAAQAQVLTAAAEQGVPFCPM